MVPLNSTQGRQTTTLRNWQLLLRLQTLCMEAITEYKSIKNPLGNKVRRGNEKIKWKSKKQKQEISNFNTCMWPKNFWFWTRENDSQKRISNSSTNGMISRCRSMGLNLQRNKNDFINYVHTRQRRPIKQPEMLTNYQKWFRV